MSRLLLLVLTVIAATTARYTVLRDSAILVNATTVPAVHETGVVSTWGRWAKKGLRADRQPRLRVRRAALGSGDGGATGRATADGSRAVGAPRTLERRAEDHGTAPAGANGDPDAGRATGRAHRDGRRPEPDAVPDHGRHRDRGLRGPRRP